MDPILLQNSQLEFAQMKPDALREEAARDKLIRSLSKEGAKPGLGAHRLRWVIRPAWGLAAVAFITILGLTVARIFL